MGFGSRGFLVCREFDVQHTVVERNGEIFGLQMGGHLEDTATRGCTLAMNEFDTFFVDGLFGLSIDL